MLNNSSLLGNTLARTHTHTRTCTHTETWTGGGHRENGLHTRDKHACDFTDKYVYIQTYTQTYKSMTNVWNVRAMKDELQTQLQYTEKRSYRTPRKNTSSSGEIVPTINYNIKLTCVLWLLFVVWNGVVCRATLNTRQLIADLITCHVMPVDSDNSIGLSAAKRGEQLRRDQRHKMRSHVRRGHDNILPREFASNKNTDRAVSFVIRCDTVNTLAALCSKTHHHLPANWTPHRQLRVQIEDSLTQKILVNSKLLPAVYRPRARWIFCQT